MSELAEPDYPRPPDEKEDLEYWYCDGCWQLFPTEKAIKEHNCDTNDFMIKIRVCERSIQKRC